MDPQAQYWIAPDGNKRQLTPQQIEQLLASSQASTAGTMYPTPEHQHFQDQSQPTLAPHALQPPPAYDAPASFSSSSHHMPPGPGFSPEMRFHPRKGSSSSSSSSTSSDSSDFETYLGSRDLKSPDAQQKAPTESQPVDDRPLDENLSWIPREQPPAYRNSERLPVPVVIPQVHPGMQTPFSRAWAPILESRGVRKEEFIQFMDHLNVCKAASPPLKVLQQAGNIVGMLPVVPFGFAVRIGTTALASGGMYAIARYRIVRYMKRVNQDYFFPRGLFATVAKKNNLEEFTHLPPSLPVLAPVNMNAGPGMGNSSMAALRDRRMAAMGPHVAQLEYQASSAGSEESNILDRWSAKETEKATRKAQRKSLKKDHKDQPKDVRREAKMERKFMKAESKGKQRRAAKMSNKLAEHRAYDPGTGSSVDGPLSSSNLGPMQQQMMQDRAMDSRRSDGGKEQKMAEKFMFVVIGHLDDEMLAKLQKTGGNEHSDK